MNRSASRLNKSEAGPSERAANLRTISSGVERASKPRFGVRSTINSKFKAWSEMGTDG